MFEIYSNSKFAHVQLLYLLESKQFSFIWSVLSGIQRGRIWVDDTLNPNAAFICHDFGWSQLIGNPSAQFTDELLKFLIKDQLFSSFKLRIFSGQCNELFAQFCEISERQQFRLDLTIMANKIIHTPLNYEIESITPTNSDLVNEALQLNLFQRNWPSKEAFIKNSFKSSFL